MRYPIIIHKDPESDFGITVPDLPGCFSAGSTMEEALQNFRGSDINPYRGTSA